MRFVEQAAPRGLEDPVARIWFHETPRLRRFEKILPLPYVHLIVNLSDPYSLYDRAGRRTPVEDTFIAGLRAEYLVIESPPVIRHVVVELHPAGLGAVTGVPGAEVAGRVRDAGPLVEGIDRLRAELRADLRAELAELGPGAVDGPSAATEVLLERVATFVTERARGWRPDPVLVGALRAIEQDPSAPIADVARSAGVSLRTLLARVRATTGVTPKAYAQLWRFHRFVTDVARVPDRPDWAALAVDAGYYDQPHVIRAFRRFSGWTPTEHRRRVAEFGPAAAHFVPLDEVPVSGP